MSAKVVFITGCSEGGIGHALCEEFAAHDCKVYATARRLEAMQSLTQANIEKLTLDVTVDASVEEAVKTVINREGRIDILVNNAGVLYVGPLIEAPLEDVQRVFDTNTFSVLRVSQAVFPHMAARKSGTIVNIGSITGNHAVAWQGLYSMTKASLTRLSEILYMELAPFGLAVVHVNTGCVRSNVVNNALATWRGLAPDTQYGAWRETIAERFTFGQDGAGAIPVDDFARHVVREVLRAKPPRYVSYGALCWMDAILAWLPRLWTMVIMWRFTAGKPKPSKS